MVRDREAETRVRQRTGNDMRQRGREWCEVEKQGMV